VRLETEPKAILALDIETTPRWWWYDGKATNRVMMFVGQWVDSRMGPFGWIFTPKVILEGLTDSRSREYQGLPMVSREQGLRMVSLTIADADSLLGHNVRDFDLPSLDGELMIANMPMLPRRTVLDTLRDTERTAGQSRSLGNRLARLPETVDKPHVEPVVWERAFHDFEPAALREVWERSTADVQGHIDLFVNDREKGYL
jgi:hypothetical protein